MQKRAGYIVIRPFLLKIKSMKKIFFTILSIQLCIVAVGQTNFQIKKGERNNAKTSRGLKTDLKPFYHGVASGDPQQNSVWLWTRVTPDGNETSINLDYKVATDTGFINLVTQGNIDAIKENDFTVKVEVLGLNPNTYYYYYFTNGTSNSVRGRTKTLPTTGVDHLRFAVVSCSNYEAGFFNAYNGIANRNDLDAVIHLGDYIYEYEAGVYGDSTLSATGERSHSNTETISLEEYRARYSLYRLDEDLMRAHQQHPFICIWDDHETANDSYKDGAENHDPATEGNWETRKSVAKKAYFEWIPIAESADSSIYRSFEFGDLMELIMLDTRLEGREEQINDVTNPALYAPNRTLLGQQQYNWFTNAVSNSNATWKVVGNQVIFSEFHVGWAAQAGQTPVDVENIFLDIWDGYPAERLKIINHLESNNINNMVFLTGDFHSTFAFDVADSVTDPSSFYAPTSNYNPATGEGSVAVEFATPSITSANFDENLDPTTATLFEIQINNPLPGTTANIPNPHMKFVDLDRHGYFVLDVKSDSTQADYYYVDKINAPSTFQSYGGGVKTIVNQNHLTTTQNSSSQKSTQAVPAPKNPIKVGTSVESKSQNVNLISLYPNPASNFVMAQFGLENAEEFTISIFAQNGLVSKIIKQDFQPGVYDLKIDLSGFKSGAYVISFYNNNFEFSRKLIIE